MSRRVKDRTPCSGARSGRNEAERRHRRHDRSPRARRRRRACVSAISPTRGAASTAAMIGGTRLRRLAPRRADASSAAPRHRRRTRAGARRRDALDLPPLDRRIDLGSTGSESSPLRRSKRVHADDGDSPRRSRAARGTPTPGSRAGSARLDRRERAAQRVDALERPRAASISLVSARSHRSRPPDRRCSRRPIRAR